MQDGIASRLNNHEEKLNLFERLFLRKIDYSIRLIYYLTSGEPFSTTIIAILIIALIIVIYLYQRRLSTDKSSPKTYPYNKNVNVCQSSSQHSNQINVKPIRAKKDDLKILELNAETYNGMVRLLKPGHRSIIILTDRETKDKLVPLFKEAVWPYRRNRTLLFGHLCLDRNLEWYKTLLENILEVEELNVNKKNCVGTVLSLNGFRKYFRVYHAKHYEGSFTDDSDEDGSFLSFSNDPEVESLRRADIKDRSSRDEVYTVGNLLERLPDWLDRMFEGQTKRYYLDFWPEEMK